MGEVKQTSLLLLISMVALSTGHIHNPFFSIFGPGSNPSKAAVQKTEDISPDPALKALLFMSSEKQGDQRESGGSNSEDTKSGPTQPVAVGDLFHSTDVSSLHSVSENGKSNGQNSNKDSGEETGKVHMNSFPAFLDSKNSLSKVVKTKKRVKDRGGDKKSGEIHENERVVPGLFGATVEGKHKKIRRNRNRNSHRKLDQRHMTPDIKGQASKQSSNKTEKLRDMKRKRHNRALSKSKNSRKITKKAVNNVVETKINDEGLKNPKKIHHRSVRRRLHNLKNVQPPDVAGTNIQVIEKDFKVQKGLHDNSNPEETVHRPAHTRPKRAAHGMKKLPLPGYPYDHNPSSRRTLYYRMPPEGGHRRVRLQHSSLLRTGAQEEEAPEAIPVEPAVPKRLSEGEALERDEDILLPQSAGHSGSAQKEMPDTPSNDGLQESSAENSSFSGMNATAQRHLLRSPMLVDYGSRVRPQDIVLPTDPPSEEVAEEEAEEELREKQDEVEEKDTLMTGKVPEETELAHAEETPEKVIQEEVEDFEESIKPEAEVPKAETETVHINTPISGGFQNEKEVGDPEPEPELGHGSEASLSPPSEEEPKGEVEPEEEQGEPEAESTTEPEVEEETSIEKVSYAEPQPVWEEAKKDWGPWWEVHIYGIGLAYAVLCTYSFISIIRLWRRKNLFSQGYFIALNCIMFIMGFFRALYFLVDGYNSNRTFSTAGHYFLYSIGFPCLTSAFSILLLALLNTLKMQLVSPKIQRTSVLIGIIAAHFLFSIATDVIVGYLYTAKIMMLVCQITTVLWGLCLFIGYIYVFRQLYKAAVWRQNELMRISLAKIKMDGIAPITKPPRMTLNVAVKVTLATAIFGLVLAALQTYGIFSINSVLSDEVPNPWTWLLYNTGLLLTELAMCITMSYVATQPFRYKQSGKMDDHHSSCVNALFYMAPCRRMFECDSVSLYEDDLDFTDFPTHGDVEQQDVGHNTAEESTPMTASGRAAQAAAAAAVAGQSDVKETSKKSNKVVPRPASLLVSENGFIRFREDEESGGSPVLLSTDDELENNSVENMLRNPFYRDLLRRQEKERAVGRATFVNSDGITLQDEFGLAESITDQELIPPPRPTYPIRGCSYPNTGTNTPGTPRSFCSTDLEYAASEISYRPPSSIHLRDSIENALNIPGFTLKTPDLLDSPLTMAYIRTRRGSLLSRGSRPTGSMNDLESLKHYGPVSKYSDSHDTIDYPSERAASPDSMYSYTLSNLTRAPLVRSYSDSIGRTSLAEASIPNSPERQYYKARVQASMLKNNPENHNQFQNLLRNINDMCNAYNKLSPDDREGDE